MKRKNKTGELVAKLENQHDNYLLENCLFTPSLLIQELLIIIEKKHVKVT